MQVVPGLFTSRKVSLKLFVDPIFSNILSSRYFFFFERGWMLRRASCLKTIFAVKY